MNVSKISKRQKRPKDPNAPKRPATAYFLWLTKNRSKLAEEVGSAKGSVVAPFAAKRWKEASEEVHNKWKTKAENLKNAYKVALHDYEQTDASKAFKEAMEKEKEQQTKSEQAASSTRELDAGAVPMNSTTDELFQELRRRMDTKDRRIEQLEHELSVSQGQVETLEQKVQKLQKKGSGQAHASPAASTQPEQFEESSKRKRKADENHASGGDPSLPLKATGYDIWLSKRWAKFAEELGPCPDDVINAEASKRWKHLSEEKRQSWAEKADKQK